MLGEELADLFGTQAVECVNKANPGVELGITSQPFLDAWHSDQDQTDQHPLYHLMADILDAMIARATPQTAVGRRDEMGDLARVADDLFWTFTRNDAIYRDRLVYEAFASPSLDNPWHIARRRCVGPAAFRNLILEARHRLLATAVAFAGPVSLRIKFLGAGRNWEEDIAGLRNHLDHNDRKELAKRQRHGAGRHASPPDKLTSIYCLRNQIRFAA
jgi:hypothetical protein